MPYGDKTGPLGKGPRTGRGLGDCSFDISPSTKEESNIQIETFEMGRGMGREREFGIRNSFWN